MKKLPFLLAVLVAAICAAQDISPLLVPINTAVTTGSQAYFWLVYLNSGTTAATIHIQKTLGITLESPGTMRDHVLIAQEPSNDRTIEPGAFIRVRYSLALPHHLAGRLIVKLKSPGATPVVLTATLPPPQPLSPPPMALIQPHDPATMPATIATQPAPCDATHWLPDPFTEAFAGRFSTYQPTYFIAGSRPTAKIQISLKYKLFDEEGSLAENHALLNHLYLAYTQTSFWDWVSPSTPFTDNSYRPELMFAYDNILSKDSTLLDLSQLGLQGGFQHESNGRDGLASRSMNLIYVRPIFVWDIDKANEIFISLAPRVFAYVTDVSDNPDIAQYRGYGDVRLVIGQRYGFQAAIFARVGEDFNKGSFELDLSQPLRARSRGNLDLYLYAQFFTGFGEQLIQYNKSTTTFRIGVAFVR